MKHTPGPWTLGPQGAYNEFPILAVVTRPVALAKNPFGRDDNGETEANARLIAAAPELLAALRAAMFFVPVGTDTRVHADAAIDKAEGVKS